MPTAAPRVLGPAVRRAGCTRATEVPDGTQALAGASADAYLAEPFSAAELVARVRELTSGATA